MHFSSHSVMTLYQNPNNKGLICQKNLTKLRLTESEIWNFDLEFIA